MICKKHFLPKSNETPLVHHYSVVIDHHNKPAFISTINFGDNVVTNVPLTYADEKGLPSSDITRHCKCVY